MEDKKEIILDKIESNDQNKQKKLFNSRKKAIIIASVSTVLSIVLVACLLIVFVFNYTFPTYLITYRNIDDLKQSYELDATNSYIDNINYEDYLEEASFKTGDAVFVSSLTGIGDNASQNAQILSQLMFNISENDGGTVVFDRNLTSLPIRLYDDITIVIMYGVNVSLAQVSSLEKTALFYAIDAENIKIMGPGTLIGNSQSYTQAALVNEPLMPLTEFSIQKRYEEYTKRIRPLKNNIVAPDVLSFKGCDEIVITNVILKDSAANAVSFEDCEDIKIKNAIINNNINTQNANGVYINSSSYINIDHVFISTQKDGISINASLFENINKIKVNRCTIIAQDACFRIGAKSSKNMNNLDLTNCYFTSANIKNTQNKTAGAFVGISIESLDGSNINDVYVDNIAMDGISSPVVLWLGNRLDVNYGSIGKVGSIKNVSISNVKCSEVEMPAVLTGCKIGNINYYLQDIRLANFNVECRQMTEVLNEGKASSELSSKGQANIWDTLLEEEIKYDFPVYGIFARHIKGFKVINYDIKARENTKLAKDNITNENTRYDTQKVFLR